MNNKQIDYKTFNHRALINSKKLVLDESLFESVNTIDEYYYPTKEKYTATVNGKEVKFSRVWGGHRFTDDECDKLANGETITITISNSHRPYSVVDVRGKLEDQVYNGHPFTGFKAEEFTNNRSDEQELKRVIDFPLGISITDLEAEIEKYLTKANTSTEYKITFFHRCEQFDNTEFYCVDIGTVINKALSVVAVVQDGLVVDYLENKDWWPNTINKSKYGKKYAQVTKEREEQRIQKQKEDEENAEKDRIEKIRNTAWRDVSLNDYTRSHDTKDIKIWLNNNLDNFDANTPIFKYKKVNFTDYHPRNTMADVGVAEFYIVPLIQDFPEQLIAYYFEGPIESSRIESASYSDMDVEPDVKYVVSQTLHGTD